MKALTVRPPWSWAITHGGKNIENRTWGTIYRGEIAIHAGNRWDRAGADDPRVARAAAAVADGVPAGVLLVLAGAPDVVPRGALVAVADLVGICSASWSDGDPCGCGPWAALGQHHWRLANVRPLTEPIPCRGAQGLWTVPAEHTTALELAAASRSTAHQPTGGEA